MTERQARNGTYRESGYGFSSLVGSRLQREMLSLYILKSFDLKKAKNKKKEKQRSVLTGLTARASRSGGPHVTLFWDTLTFTLSMSFGDCNI